ncbi:hypothetical protein TRVL_06187 [Trypanosoma vivax]|nr:hypothetical protein TRVL_06187 [Trypanosoma vivax]
MFVPFLTHQPTRHPTQAPQTSAEGTRILTEPNGTSPSPGSGTGDSFVFHGHTTCPKAQSQEHDHRPLLRLHTQSVKTAPDNYGLQQHGNPFSVLAHSFIARSGNPLLNPPNLSHFTPTRVGYLRSGF